MFLDLYNIERFSLMQYKIPKFLQQKQLTQCQTCVLLIKKPVAKYCFHKIRLTCVGSAMEFIFSLKNLTMFVAAAQTLSSQQSDT